MPTGQSHRSGSPPKPASKRRRANTPASHGAATPVNAGQAAAQPKLSFPRPHPAVRRMWKALGDGVEAKFYGAADWERANMEMLYIHCALTDPKGISSSAWQRVQQGLNELLVSPSEKRRAGIELRPLGDADEDAAELQIAEYQSALAS